MPSTSGTSCARMFQQVERRDRQTITWHGHGEQSHRHACYNNIFKDELWKEDLKFIWTSHLLYGQNVWNYHHEYSLPNCLDSAWRNTTEKTRITLLVLNFIPVVPRWSGFFPHAHIPMHVNSDRFNWSIPTASKASYYSRSDLPIILYLFQKHKKIVFHKNWKIKQ